MNQTDLVLPPGNAEAKLLLLTCLVAAGWLGAVVYFDLFPEAIVPTAYALPVILAPSLFLAIRLAKKGTARFPVALGVVGFVFIVGGGAFDMIATAMHSPDLRLESNPIARSLLDSGHSVEFVYGYAIVAQTLWLILICTLWLALLRHRDLLAASIDHETGPRFFKAATGGAHLTWRQWIIPFSMSDLPRAYHLFWILVVVLVAGLVDRWYLGFRWHGLVPAVRLSALGAALCLGLIAYFVWLWQASRHACCDTK